ELAHAALLSGRDDVVLGLWLLKDHPLSLNEIARVSPIAARLEIAEIQAVLQPDPYARQAARDLARDKRLAADRRLVVEENAVAGVEAVSFSIVDRNPVGVQLGYAVRRARIERRSLALRRFAHLAVQLRARCLIEPGSRFQFQDSYGFEKAQRAERIGVGRVLRLLERHRDMTLRGEVVDFVGLGLLHDTHQAR